MTARWLSRSNLSKLSRSPAFVVIVSILSVSIAGCGGPSSSDRHDRDASSTPVVMENQSVAMLPADSGTSPELSRDSRSETVIAAWDNQVLRYGQIRHLVDRENAQLLAYSAGNKDFTDYIVDQMQKQVDDIVLRVLKVEEAKARDISVTDQEIEDSLREMKAAAQNEETFKQIVRGAEGAVLEEMIRNQLLIQKFDAAMQNDFRNAITEEKKQEFYTRNRDTLFTPKAVTEGRRFIVRICSEPSEDLIDSLIRLIRFKLKGMDAATDPTVVRAAVAAISDDDLKANLQPGPQFWQEEAIPVLRKIVERLSEMALKVRDDELTESAKGMMPELRLYFKGRSDGEAKLLAEAMRAQAAELIADCTDIECTDNRFKRMVRDRSEDQLAGPGQNQGLCYIYHIMGPDGPEKSFGAEFMETVRGIDPGRLSPVVPVPLGYGFMLVKRQQPQITLEIDSEQVQKHLPYLIMQEMFDDWKQSIFAKHQVAVHHELLSQLAKADYGGQTTANP